jgi:hypothetical protein
MLSRNETSTNGMASNGAASGGASISNDTTPATNTAAVVVDDEPSDNASPTL